MAAALLLVLGACSDRGGPVSAPPSEASAPQPLLAMSVLCQADRVAATVRCGGIEPTGTARGAIVVGGQGLYVQLTSSNVVSVPGTFSFDVTVQNLIPQAMGTTDGTTGDPAGVRVFFASGPTTTGGTGNVTVANHDGTGTFTNTNQKYFQYSGALNGADGILSTSETTGAKNWQMSVDPGVTHFSFTVYVAAEVRFPNGWIDVTPAAPSVLQGNAQALTATVRSAVGNVLAGQTVTWGTTDAAVVTVDGSGTATGAGVGTAGVTATSGPRSGSAAVSVCPNLAVGGVYTGVMPLASSLCFGGGGADEEFTYMPVNLSGSSALSLTLTATGIQAVTGPPSPIRAPAEGPRLGRSAANEPAIDEDFRARLLERDRVLGERMYRKGNYRVRRQSASPGGPRRLITAGVPSVGDLMNLNVAQGCSGALDTRVGQVRSIGQHVIVVSDTANPPGGFTTAQYDSIALEFDSLAYAVDTTSFGGPTDLDTNQRVVAFYTRAVNELSPPASSVVVLGFFTSRDLFSSAPASCPRSNEGEMFYMLVPDPTGAVNSNVRTVSFVRGSTVGTMAHELQHLINASRRVYLNGTWSGVFEEVWLNEGLSHVAEELVFYRASVGLAPRGNIVVTQLTTGPNASRRVAAFNTYANANFGRWRGWLQRPDTSGPVKNVDALASRGAAWSFLRYASDRVNGVETAFWSSLVNTQTTGAANLSAAIGGASVDDWVRDWIAANYGDDAVAGIAAQYTHPSWNYRSLYIALNTSYQLVPRPLSNGVGLTLSYSRGGSTAYARFGVPASGFAKVTALSGGVPPSSPYALIVMRTR
ncbi:MAG: Ig-like domain-containing protein [Longimicrobiaceae bacterium]